MGSIKKDLFENSKPEEKNLDETAEDMSIKLDDHLLHELSEFIHGFTKQHEIIEAKGKLIDMIRGM